MVCLPIISIINNQSYYEMLIALILNKLNIYIHYIDPLYKILDPPLMPR